MSASTVLRAVLSPLAGASTTLLAQATMPTAAPNDVRAYILGVAALVWTQHIALTARVGRLERRFGALLQGRNRHGNARTRARTRSGPRAPDPS